MIGRLLSSAYLYACARSKLTQNHTVSAWPVYHERALGCIAGFRNYLFVCPFTETASAILTIQLILLVPTVCTRLARHKSDRDWLHLHRNLSHTPDPHPLQYAYNSSLPPRVLFGLSCLHYPLIPFRRAERLFCWGSHRNCWMV